MRFDIDVSQHQLTWDRMLQRIRFVEEAGFTGAWLFDHFKALYGPAGGPCFEAWTLLAALAASTTTIRLGTLVTGVTYRHPSILATEVVTADHVSNGRVELGMGASWFGEEHVELGIDFPGARERIDRLDEAVQVITKLMTEERATFDGRYYRLRNATYRPLPVQRPHPPLWIGGSGEKRMLPLVARRADVWHAYGSVRELSRKSRLLDELAERVGRDPAAIERSTNLSISEPWAEVQRRLDGLRDAGFATLIVDWPSEGEGRVGEFVERVLANP